MSKQLGLSMSGGGVKSLIYLGVIQALAENGIKPDVLGGLSGGSIAAGLLGMGFETQKIYDTVIKVHISEMLDLNPFDGVEVLDQEKVYDFFKTVCGDKQIQDCQPQVVIFATDYNTQQQVVLETGELARAIVASCALFPVMRPVAVEGRLLEEGGLTTLYGANYLRDKGAEVVIGLDVNGFANIHLGGTAELAFHSFDATVHKMGEYEKQLFPVDLEITDFNDETGMFEFSKAGQRLVDVGHAKAVEMMPSIQKLLA